MGLKIFLLLSVSVAVCGSSASAATPCPIERAHYVLRGAPTVTAGFRDLPHLKGWLTDVALHVDFRKERDRFWWLFDQGSARYLTMISATDVDSPAWKPPDEEHQGTRPLPEVHIWFADQSYGINYKLPKPGQAAPAHFFIPDLEEVMWYSAEPRRWAPNNFFDLKSCSEK